MKRAPLNRLTPLKAARPRHLKLVDEPGRESWKLPRSGWCQCGCEQYAAHLEHHHVVLEQIIRREGGDPWDLDNGMLLHPDCHARHHTGFRKIKLDNVPDKAFDYAAELLGAARAMDYFERRYDVSNAEPRVA